MTEFFYDSSQLIISSFLLGVIVGLFYDTLRIVRIARTPHIKTPRHFERICNAAPFSYKKIFESSSSSKTITILTFIEDILFFTVATVSLILFFLSENDGEIRLYCLLFFIFGFIVYICSIGKITLSFSTTIIFLLRWLLYWIVYIIMLPIRSFFSCLLILYQKIYSSTFKRIASSFLAKRSNTLKNKFVADAIHGFGIFKEK